MNFHNRFMPSFIDAKRIIDSGEIGEVQLVQIEASPGARPGGRLATWRVDPAMAGLGTTMSIGVHVYDILRFLLGSEIDDGVGVLRHASQRDGGNQSVDRSVSRTASWRT